MLNYASPLKPLPRAPGQAAAINALPGGFGCWPFWEGSGTTVMDLAGRSAGTVSGAAWQASSFGPALAFDGIDDYVRVAYTPHLNSPHVTMAVLAYFESYGAYASNGRQILEKGLPAWGSPYYQYLIQVYDNGTRRVVDGAAAINGTLCDLRIELPMTAGWQHLAWTYDGRQICGYLNGRQAAAPLACPGTINGYPTDLYFARATHFLDPITRFRGKLAAVWLSSEALDAGQVARLACDVFAPIRRRRQFAAAPNAGRLWRLAAAQCWTAGAAAAAPLVPGAAVGQTSD